MSLPTIRSLLPSLTEEELITLVYEIMNAENCAYSDRTADLFYRAFAVLDEDVAASNIELARAA